MGTWRAEPLLPEGLFGPGDFAEIAAWIDSPEGRLSFKISNLVARQLKKADVDADNRKIVWADGQRLSITERRSIAFMHATRSFRQI